MLLLPRSKTVADRFYLLPRSLLRRSLNPNLNRAINRKVCNRGNFKLCDEYGSAARLFDTAHVDGPNPSQFELRESGSDRYFPNL